MNQQKLRIALFGSAYQGESILNALLSNDVLGANTEAVELPLRVERLARQHEIPVYCGDLKDRGFLQTFRNDWNPDLSVCCFFGQKITEPYREVAEFGSVNFHPCVRSPFTEWPSKFAGTLPIKRMRDEGHQAWYWAAHFMTDEFDGGPPIAFSRPMPIRPGKTIAETHAAQGPLIAACAVDVAAVLFRFRRPADVRPPVGNADFGPLDNWEAIQHVNPIRARYTSDDRRSA